MHIGAFFADKAMRCLKCMAAIRPFFQDKRHFFQIRPNGPYLSKIAVETMGRLTAHFFKIRNQKWPLRSIFSR